MQSCLRPRPANIASAIALAGLFLLIPACLLRAQAASDQPATSPGKLAFDVASIRQNKTDNDSHSNFSLDNGNAYFTLDKSTAVGPNSGYFSATAIPLLRYIVFAYNLSGTQELALRFNFWSGTSSNVPKWVAQERFDIEARSGDTPVPTKDQVRQMMRSLLEDRFKLAVHLETRQVPVFALVLDKPGTTGPQLRPHTPDDSCAVPESSDPQQDSASAPASRAPQKLPLLCGVIAHLPPGAPALLKFGGRNVTLAAFAASLPTQAGLARVQRPVIDRTGLTGSFDFSVEWSPERDNPASESDGSGPTLFQAIKDQLGLKLDSQKGPIDVIVIDHIEPPTDN
jgi:uncharacterized protein (TIGR03435 family)